MSVLVINIAKELEPILSFLYPTYSITDSVVSVSEFITHRDIASKRERDALDICYSDCIFISTQIFDEYWDESVIKAKCVEFARVHFKSRKKVLNSNIDFITDCINFMFDSSTEEQEKSIFELFDTFGTAQFSKKFFEITSVVPIPVVISSMNTFINKILSDEGTLYYKRKQILFRDKIKNNIIPALDNLTLRPNDEYGLSMVRFYNDLVK